MSQVYVHILWLQTPLTNHHPGFAYPGFVRDVHHHVRHWYSDIWSYDDGRGARGDGRGDEECGCGARERLMRISYISWVLVKCRLRRVRV